MSKRKTAMKSAAALHPNEVEEGNSAAVDPLIADRVSKVSKEVEKLDLTGDYSNLLLLLLLYTLQGIPMGLAGSIPFLLQEKGASFVSQSIFSLASWPFSLKILWAPIVDALYFQRYGRRKTWLIPVQLLTGSIMVGCAHWLEFWLSGTPAENKTEGSGPDVQALAGFFFLLYFLMATQDIAVDGWALTMLSKRNVGLASTCNAIGQTIGYFVAYTGFLALYSFNYVTLSAFVQFWGCVFLSTTVLLACKTERRAVPEEDEGVLQAYRQAAKICMLPPVRRLILMLLTARIFTAAEGLVPLKLMAYGLPKERLALISAFMTPISIAMPSLISRFTTGPRPLDVYMWAYLGRMVCVVVAATVVYLAIGAQSDPSTDGLPTYVYVAIIIALVLHTAVSATQFTAQMAFYNTIARNMPQLGGTYMTLLNTFTNLGFMWPASLGMSLVDATTWRECAGAADSDDRTGGCAEKMCEDAGGHCEVTLDGYFVLSAVCFAFGGFWFWAVMPAMRRLQDVRAADWAVGVSHGPMGRQH